MLNLAGCMKFFLTKDLHNISFQRMRSKLAVNKIERDFLELFYVLPNSNFRPLLSGRLFVDCFMSE